MDGDTTGVGVLIRTIIALVGLKTQTFKVEREKSMEWKEEQKE